MNKMNVPLILSKISSLFTHIVDSSPLRSWSRSPSQSNLVSWLKSLSAIYDLDKLADLDVAWWPYKVIAEIENFLIQIDGPKVFEWGSGASTIWLLRRGCEVSSIEHDAIWAKRLTEKVNELNYVTNIRVIEPKESKKIQISSGKKGYTNLEFKEYVDAINSNSKINYDLIIIDGRARLACLNEAIKKLKKGGIILFDNSNRRRYQKKLTTYRKTRKFFGLTPAAPIPTQSSILFFD